MPRTVKILSIDGGGIRGIIPSTVLQHIEKRAGKPISALFDLIAGTSTGACLTLLLTKPGPRGKPMYSAEDVVNMYLEHGKDMFHRSAKYAKASQNGLTKPKYPAKSVASTIGGFLDQHERATLRDALTNVMVTAWDVNIRKPIFFVKRPAVYNIAHPRENFYMADLAQGAVGFPGTFPAAEARSVGGKKVYHLIDGGVFGANPSVYALSEAMALYGRGASFLFVSLGTGDCETPLGFRRVREWGLQAWGPHLVEVMFDATNHGADDQMRELLRGRSGRAYYRFQTPIPSTNEPIDKVNPSNLRALEGFAHQMLRKQKKGLDELLERLAG